GKTSEWTSRGDCPLRVLAARSASAWASSASRETTIACVVAPECDAGAVHRRRGGARSVIEKLFGYGFRTTEDKLRTASALERVPEPRAARQPHVGERRCHREPARPANDATARPPKATQTIPPAVRRYVLHRDHGCCVMPGRAHGKFLDVHHLRARAEGGTHEPDTLVTLVLWPPCRAAPGSAVDRGHPIDEASIPAR